MRRGLFAVLAVGVPLALVACGGGNTGGGNTGGSSSGGGSGCNVSSSSSSGSGGHLSIGSKAFAEEQLLAEMTKQVLQAHGFTVDYTFQAKDKAIGQAVQSGTIDMLWQYTGTELTDYLGLTTGQFPTDLNGAFSAVQQKDAAKGLCWVAQGGFDDTNGIAIKASDRGTYGDTLSAFGTYLASHPGTKICILSEFRTRPDGLPGLQSTYNHAYGQASYTDIESTAEKNIANGDCVAGEVFTTDSAIKAKDLYVLQDDKNLFPPDNVGLIVRQSVLQQYPQIASLMAPVATMLDNQTIIGLNAMVEIQNLKVSDVAHGWLVQNGFLNS